MKVAFSRGSWTKSLRRYVHVSMLVAYSTGVGLSPAAVAAQPPSGEDEGWSPFPCPQTFSGALPIVYQQKVFYNTFRRTSIANEPYIAWFVGIENPFTDVTHRWEWLSPGGLVQCWTYQVVPGINVDEFRMSMHSGNVIPFGRDEIESELTADPGTLGGDSGTQFDDYYICWYYRYPDGSRSAYYRCDPVS